MHRDHLAPGLFPAAAARSGGRIVGAVGSAYTTALGNWAFASRPVRAVGDAEDAVQETMLAAWQGLGGFAEERASLRTWLYKIATNRCLNARRAASRQAAREPAAAASQRYGLTHCHPGQARTAYEDPQSGGSSRVCHQSGEHALRSVSTWQGSRHSLVG